MPNDARQKGDLVVRRSQGSTPHGGFDGFEIVEYPSDVPGFTDIGQEYHRLVDIALELGRRENRVVWEEREDHTIIPLSCRCRDFAHRGHEGRPCYGRVAGADARCYECHELAVGQRSELSSRRH